MEQRKKSESSFAICGVGPSGEEWARSCLRATSELRLIEHSSTDLKAALANTVVLFVFANLNEAGVKQEFRQLARVVCAQRTTCLAFAVGAHERDIPPDNTVLTLASVVSTSENPMELAIEFACEVVKMATEEEMMCVDVADVNITLRGPYRAYLCKGSSDDFEQGCGLAVRETARKFDSIRKEVNALEFILCRVVTDGFSGGSMWLIPDALKDVGSRYSYVWGIRVGEQLPNNRTEALSLFVCATDPRI